MADEEIVRSPLDSLPASTNSAESVSSAGRVRTGVRASPEPPCAAANEGEVASGPLDTEPLVTEIPTSAVVKTAQATSKGIQPLSFDVFGAGASAVGTPAFTPTEGNRPNNIETRPPTASATIGNITIS